MFDFSSPKTVDYFAKQLVKFIGSDPELSGELKIIVADVLGAKKDTLKHHSVAVSEIDTALRTKANIPGDVQGHLLTVTDRKGRTRYLYFV